MALAVCIDGFRLRMAPRWRARADYEWGWRYAGVRALQRGVNHASVLQYPPPVPSGDASVSCPYISIKRQLFSHEEQEMVGHTSVFITPPLFTPLGY
jgi:hypothetical protein